ncbi:hypothetical protein [Spiroplasma endosymbiont of Amphimallon solstitiale]|uniref:hypothetical protein n=1 Tax=Spiroplasma endosymbiont of Amphimallon solstitiale TaxID=3066288 RepID=UPI00313F395B
MPLDKDKDKQDLQIKIFTDEQIQLLTEDDIKSLSIEQIQVFNEKIEVLDKEVEKRTIILSDYIDVITDATSKITSLLEENVFLEKQKIGNFKNFIIRMFSFGCINKNKRIEKKLNKNKKEIQEKTNERTDLKIIFENISLERKKINDELNNLIKLTELWKNINDKKNSIKNTSSDKEFSCSKFVEEINALELTSQTPVNDRVQNLP